MCIKIVNLEEMMLSNIDIVREIIKCKDFAIYPLNTDNINGSSINLTASDLAWYSAEKNTVTGSQEEPIIIDTPGKYAVKDEKINIPKGETVNILTKEAIWVSRKISGTYHSRVSLSAKGLSNISTTLDPKWCGLSLISITNNSKYDQSINVGDGIVTLTLHYLNKKASKDHVEIAASRQDIYNRFDMTEIDPERVQYLQGNEHRTPFRIKENMRESDIYKQLRQDTPLKRFYSNILLNPIVLLVIGAVLTKVGESIYKLISGIFS